MYLLYDGFEYIKLPLSGLFGYLPHHFQSLGTTQEIPVYISQFLLVCSSTQDSWLPEED